MVYDLASPIMTFTNFIKQPPTLVSFGSVFVVHHILSFSIGKPNNDMTFSIVSEYQDEVSILVCLAPDSPKQFNNCKSIIKFSITNC